jgi:hypothetical protein
MAQQREQAMQMATNPSGFNFGAKGGKGAATHAGTTPPDEEDGKATSSAMPFSFLNGRDFKLPADVADQDFDFGAPVLFGCATIFENIRAPADEVTDCVNMHLDFAFVLDPTDTMTFEGFPFDTKLPLGIFLSPRAKMDAESVFGLIETLFRGLAMHITGGQGKLATMFAADLVEAVTASLAARAPGMTAAPAGEAVTEGAESAMAPQRAAEDPGVRASAEAQAVLGAPFQLRLQVFFALIRDGVNHIYMEK